MTDPTPAIPTGEFGFIGWIREQQQATTGAADGVHTGPGDDCAVLDVPGGGDRLVMTTDMMLEGAHFDLTTATPEQVGRKLLAVSLSDVAAMGGTPLWAVTSVGFGTRRDDSLKAGLWHGLQGLAAEAGVALVGGDVTAWPATANGGLALALTLVGRMDGLAPVLRSGAQVGDILVVTGSLGGSLAGRHLAFTPRIPEGRHLAAAGARAMIDLSDGLSGDLGHICNESHVGARLTAAAIPVNPAARALADALHDGEDFELLAAVPPDRLDALLRDWPFTTPLTPIGEITPATTGRTITHTDGTESPLATDSWDHLR